MIGKVIRWVKKPSRFIRVEDVAPYLGFILKRTSLPNAAKEEAVALAINELLVRAAPHAELDIYALDRITARVSELVNERAKKRGYAQHLRKEGRD